MRLGTIQFLIAFSFIGFFSSAECFTGGARRGMPSLTGHWIFITPTQTSGNLGGLAGADTNCQTYASSTGLRGTWKAVLGDETTSLASRMSITGPVYNLAGNLIVNNQAEFLSASWQHAVIYDFNAQLFYGTAATGATVTGGINAGSTCSSWTSTSGSTYGCYTYYKSNNLNCGTGWGCTSTNIRYHCISSNVNNTVRVQPTFSVWHRAFVTSNSWTGDLGGVSGADSKCQAAAGSAGLVGTFKALLCSSTTNSISFNDNIKSGIKDTLGRILAYNPSRFVYYGNRLAPDLVVDEFGVAVTPTNAAAWSGCTVFGNKFSATPADTCDNWTQTTGTTTTSSLNSIGFLGEGVLSTACTSSKRLICISTTTSP